jgi:peptidoglycan/LPS O-acetylase OafA/YrhL
MLGYFLNVFEERFRKISNRKLGVGWLAATVLFILEIIFVVALDLQENIFITIFLYPLLALTMVLLLKNPLPKKKVLATKLRGIANFIFYSHPLCIMALSKIGNEKSKVSITSTTLFLLTSALTILVGWIFVRVNNKWLNKTFL